MYKYSLIDSSCGEKIDITAFEYQRKFGTTLDVGQCAMQLREISPGVAITKGWYVVFSLHLLQTNTDYMV